MRIACTLPLAACSALAGLVLAGCGGGETAATTAARSAPATSPPTAAGTTAPATTSAPTATTTPTAATTISVDIQAGRPAGGIRRKTVTRGTRVVLVVHSDVADEVHLHGYDLHRDVAAGGTARIAFTADLTGVFEAELEGRGLRIAELEVRP